MTQLLGGVVVAASLEQAADLTRATPGLRVVTRDGDVLGAHWAIGGSAGQQSLLEVRAAADDAATGLQEAQDQCENAAERLAVALSAESAARLAVDEARARMRQADSGAAEISGRLGRLAGAARAAGDEVRRLETAIETAQRAGEKDRARLAELTGQLTEAENSAEAADPDGRIRTVLARTGPRPTPAAPPRSRTRWPSGARWPATPRWKRAWRCARWRSGCGPSRAARDALTSAAAAERQARERAQARLRQRAADAPWPGRSPAARSWPRTGRAVAARPRWPAGTEAEHATPRAARRAQGASGPASATWPPSWTRWSSTAHGARDRPGRAPAAAGADRRRTRSRSSASRRTRWSPSTARTCPIPPAADGGASCPPLRPGRAGAAGRRRAAPAGPARQGEPAGPGGVRRAARSGTRSSPPSSRTSRRPAATCSPWSRRSTTGSSRCSPSAYADTAREFEQIFARLFPGGEGRLVLTEPDDMLATGIEVEARPPGKKVKRLSLLSGGERSLTAIAFLLAIFKARPSPFYVLDEVEAALDDTNLQRLLEHLRRAAGELPADHRHPPEADDGGRRRAVRDQHAGRRRVHRSQPAPARARDRPDRRRAP